MPIHLHLPPFEDLLLRAVLVFIFELVQQLICVLVHLMR